MRVAPASARRATASARLGRASKKAVSTRSNAPAAAAASATVTTAWLAEGTLDPCAKMTIPVHTATMSIATYVKRTGGSAGRHGDARTCRPGDRSDGGGELGDHCGGGRGRAGVFHRCPACGTRSLKL